MSQIQPPRRQLLTMPIISACVVGIDQATKAAASQIHGWAAIMPLRNDQLTLGVAGASIPLTAALMALGIILFGGYTVREASSGRQPLWVPALLFGGALSNLGDRLLLGSVRDFLAFPPGIVVNLADIAVVVGLIGFCATRLGSTGVDPEVVETRNLQASASTTRSIP